MKENNFNRILLFPNSRHKEYSDITLQNDIAIIKTIEKIEYNEYVQPACLAFGQNLDLYEPGTEAIISGWGSTLRTEKDGKNAETRNPNILQAAKLEIIDVRACNETYKKYISRFIPRQGKESYYARARAGQGRTGHGSKPSG